jgi:hypothetical protein
LYAVNTQSESMAVYNLDTDKGAISAEPASA